MKPIEPGCLALVVVTPCPYPHRDHGLYKTVTVVEQAKDAINRYLFCPHPWWVIDRGEGDMAIVVECALLRIDGHDDLLDRAHESAHDFLKEAIDA